MALSDDAAQEAAVRWLVERPYAALFYDMGTRKTSTTLEVIKRLKPLLDKPVLIVAPRAVSLSTWPREWEKWGYDELYSLEVAVGSREERLSAINKRADVTVVNVDVFTWLAETVGNRWPWGTVVLDELSQYRGRNKSKRFKTAKWVRTKADRVIGLTGTPSPKGLLDLWAIMYCIDEGERLGRYFTRFRDRFFELKGAYANPRYSSSWIPKLGAEAEIYRLIGDVVLSHKSSELPDFVYVETQVPLSAEDMKRYKYLEREQILDYAGSEITAGNAAVLAGKLAQLASGAIYDDEKRVVGVHRAKVEALSRLVEEAAEPILVGYWYKHTRDILLDTFGQARVLDTDSEDDWNARKIPLALAHPASVGHGLNLQYGGRRIVWFDQIWDLELYQQLNKRLLRPGQEEEVIVEHLVATGTVDERIISVLRGKATIQDALTEALRV